MIIDSHQHFWQLDQFDYSWMDPPLMHPIRRDRMPSDLKPWMDDTGVQKTVVVQTQHDLEENHWALRLAEEYDFIAGVVGWVDLASPQCEQQLAQLKDHPKFVGIRHVTQDEPDDDFIIRDDVLRGLKVLEQHAVPFDLLFFVKHLHHADRLGRDFPNLPMVIDHLAKPEIKHRRTEDWLPNFEKAAQHPNIFCKLSGMVTEADWNNWSTADLKPYVEAALELFGPDRCMFGSDWPVCELAGSYSQVYNALCQVLGPISDSERRKMFGETAAKFYKLKSD